MQANKLWPGLLLCGAVTLAALGLERLEVHLFHRAWLEGLVLAILLGSLIRTTVGLSPRFDAGIHFGAHRLLETAVLLLGASVSAGAILDKGAALIGGIALLVVIAISTSFAIGRAFGLPTRMALLIACGNSICGNSAIAAVAPAIDAEGKDVAASIAFTAVLGVVVVLVLPLLMPLLSLSAVQYGVFAGLTVYAVPQVLAATSAAPLASAHIGTIVKLVRVLMLGPVVLTLSLLGRGKAGGKRPPLSQMLPWFIVGFLALMALRSFNLLPAFALEPVHQTANFFTILSMAALGLGVDARSVLKAGGRVASVVVLSLLALGGISLALIHLLHVM